MQKLQKSAKMSKITKNDRKCKKSPRMQKISEIAKNAEINRVCHKSPKMPKVIKNAKNKESLKSPKMPKMTQNIAKISNAVQCHSLLSGNTDCNKTIYGWMIAP